MRIEYTANKMQREVRDSAGEALINLGLAKRVYQTRDDGPEEEISARTGKPKRRYKRRDIRPED